MSHGIQKVQKTPKASENRDGRADTVPRLQGTEGGEEDTKQPGDRLKKEDS